MKKLIFILLIIILTGCDVKYELEFKDDQLIENINIKLSSSEEKKIDDLKQYKAYAIFDNEYQQLYNVSYNNLFNFSADYKYTYNYDSFRHAAYINNCFDGFSFVNQDNNYILMTSKGFNCMMVEYNKVDDVEIVITTNHIVIESNADEIKGKKYVWNIDDENALDKEIYIKFGPVEEKNFLGKIIDFVSDNIVAIVLISVLVLTVTIGSIIIVIIGKKNNEI